MQLILNIDGFENALYEKSISQMEFGRSIGLSQNTLSHAKRKGKTVRPMTARKIMDGLGPEFDFHKIFIKKEK